MKKFKILLLSDDLRCVSGVGGQSRMLVEYLVNTGKFSFKQLGGAMKHPNYDVQMLHPDVIVKPIDGFGSPALLRQLLITEKPDALMLFTDPRQFIWVWQMEDEINQICPIIYWHVWDNNPYPEYNTVFYESTETINCISEKTYDLLKEKFPKKVKYLPHVLPKDWYYNITDDEVKALRAQTLGDKKDWFVALWVNRNAHRKMPGDVMESFKTFLDDLQQTHGHRNALLLMHTNPKDPEGPDLEAIAEMLKISDRVMYSTQHIDIPELNRIYNIADTVINVSRAEGFGLSIRTALTLGKPVIALKTGGMTEQIIDKQGNVHGVALEPIERYLVGSQATPYIYEDHFSKKDLAKAIYKIYSLSDEEKATIKLNAQKHTEEQFNYEKVMSEWKESLEETILTWKAGKQEKPWGTSHFNSPKQNIVSEVKIRKPKVKG